MDEENAVIGVHIFSICILESVDRQPRPHTRPGKLLKLLMADKIAESYASRAKLA